MCVCWWCTSRSSIPAFCLLINPSPLPPCMADGVYLLEMNLSCNLFNGAFDAQRFYEDMYEFLTALDSLAAEAEAEGAGANSSSSSAPSRSSRWGSWLGGLGGAAVQTRQKLC